MRTAVPWDVRSGSKVVTWPLSRSGHLSPLRGLRVPGCHIPEWHPGSGGRPAAKGARLPLSKVAPLARNGVSPIRLGQRLQLEQVLALLGLELGRLRGAGEGVD